MRKEWYMRKEGYIGKEWNIREGRIYGKEGLDERNGI